MFVMGIAGGSGSGKTTVVEQLLEESGDVSHLPHDAYYFSRDLMPKSLRDDPNWDHPDTLDNDLFIQHIDALRQGKPIERPDYDFTRHARKDQTIPVKPAPVLLVEGILLLAIESIRERIDLKVFIDTPADIRILRRLTRDLKERNRTLENVIEQYHTSVRPMHDRYVEPSKRFANIVVPWEEHNGPGVAVLAARVREHLPDEDIETKAV